MRIQLMLSAAVTLVAAKAGAAPPPAASSPPASATPAAAAPAPPPAPATGDVQVPDGGLRTPLPDGTVVWFEPGAQARWGGGGKIGSESAKWTHGWHVDVTDGEIDVTMPPPGKGEHAFLVSSKAGTLTIWRGRAHVTVRGETTAVSVYEGALVVGSNKQSFAVKDTAQAVVLRKAGEADKARLLPGVPRWDDTGTPGAFAVAPVGQGAMLGLAWAPVPGAASYRVQLADDAAMTHVVRSAAVGDARYVVAAPPGGGHTWAQVRAVGADGVIGEWSPPHALRVAHYQLPSGAFVARDGVVVLPQGTPLPLAENEGIEVAYENVRPGPPPPIAPVLYWSKLSGSLHLSDDAPLRIVHLRDASLGVESRLALAARQVRADVQMQPREARPGDPIDVRAVVWDPSGRVDVGSEAVTLEAMADLDPVPVAWQRMGSTWTGRIGPRRDTGRPSVVRVVVKDGLAQEIGRGFVEIGGAHASTK